MLTLKSIAPEEAPLELLLEADPSEENVRRYLAESTCYLAEEDGLAVAICVLGPVRNGRVELFNIAVRPDFQKQGIGTQLLEYVIQQAGRSGAECIELGTGTFGYQLAFYQRAGFRVDSIIKNFFTDNYDEPIFELGIQLRDMLRLVLQLN